MSCRRFLLRWCAASLFCYPLVSQAQHQGDHLRPMTGYFTGSSPAYYAQVRETLYAGLSPHRLLSAVVLPSFSPEYLLCLEQKEGKQFLTYRVCKTNIWYAGDFAYAKPPKSKRVAVDTKTVEISPSLAEALTHLFTQAIAQTKYPEPVNGSRSDGTTYTFVAYREGVGEAGGETWSPRAGTRMGDLVELVARLKQLVDAPSEQHQTVLRQGAQQLVEQFTGKE